MPLIRLVRSERSERRQVKAHLSKPYSMSPRNSSTSASNSTGCLRRSLGDKLQELAGLSPEALQVLEGLVDRLLVTARSRAGDSYEGRQA